MEAAIRELMGAGTPPRFKFKDTYASIEFPAGYTVPAQATLEAKYNELLALEEDIQKTAIEGDLEVGTSNLFVDTETGRVGIGTATPEGSLHVQGNRSIFGNNGGASDIVINDIPTARWRIATGGYALSFSKHSSASDEYSTWSEKVRIDQNGDVGIGEASPQAKLHVNGTILYNSKQETHDKYSDLSYTSSNAGTNLKSVTISYDGIAHVHVTGLVRITGLDGTNGTSTDAFYFNLRKNSTEVTSSLVGHRIAKLGYTNDTDQWKPVLLSWSGVVSTGDQIHFYAAVIENNITFNELDMNVLVV
jgi:hypothetical protein